MKYLLIFLMILTACDKRVEKQIPGPIGPQGEQGESGEPGEDGEDGEDGDDSTSVITMYQLTDTVTCHVLTSTLSAKRSASGGGGQVNLHPNTTCTSTAIETLVEGTNELYWISSNEVLMIEDSGTQTVLRKIQL